MCDVSRTSVRSEQVPRQHMLRNCHFLNLQYETKSPNYHYSQVTLSMLLNQNRESNCVRGANIEPCGTPYLIILKVEL